MNSYVLYDNIIYLNIHIFYCLLIFCMIIFYLFNLKCKKNFQVSPNEWKKMVLIILYYLK